MEFDLSKFIISKERPSDKIWRLMEPDVLGGNWISFDLKKAYNMWPDYPFNMLKEELELYHKENPYWEEFYASRREDDVRFRETTFQKENILFEYIWEKDSSGESDTRYEGISVLSNGVVLHKTFALEMDRPNTLLVAAIEPCMADKIKAIIDDKIVTIKMLSMAMGKHNANPKCYFQFSEVKIHTDNLFLERQKDLSSAKKNLLNIIVSIAKVINKQKCGIHFKKNGKIVHNVEDFSELRFTNIHKKRILERMDSYYKLFGEPFPSWLYGNVLPGLYIVQLINLSIELNKDVFSLGYVVI